MWESWLNAAHNFQHFVAEYYEILALKRERANYRICTWLLFEYELGHAYAKECLKFILCVKIEFVLHTRSF